MEDGVFDLIAADYFRLNTRMKPQLNHGTYSLYSKVTSVVMTVFRVHFWIQLMLAILLQVNMFHYWSMVCCMQMLSVVIYLNLNSSAEL
jgi:hypothetical protein